MKLKVSQTFYSFQGEGAFTGALSVWLRTFGCNLRCPGFSQPIPALPSSYVPVKIDPKTIKKLNDFPVVEYGCDTLYAIDPAFKHLRRDMDTQDVWDELVSYLPKTKDGEYTWQHPKTENDIHLCITGGEPLLQQKALGKMLFDNIEHLPNVIQFETNGTQKLDSLFEKNFRSYISSLLVFNVSLKLLNVSGEAYEWSAENIQSYIDAVSLVSLKIVVNSSDDAWFELEKKISKLKSDLGYLLPVYIMPVGSTYEQQTETAQIEKIVRRAIDNGYAVSGRLHCTTMGNAIDV